MKKRILGTYFSRGTKLADYRHTNTNAYRHSQGSASVTGSRDPAVQVPEIGVGDRDNRDPPEKSRPGPKIRKSGTRNSKIRDLRLGPGPRLEGRRIPGLNYSGLSQGLKKSGTRSRGLKILRDTVPVPCRPLNTACKYKKCFFLYNINILFEHLNSASKIGCKSWSPKTRRS